MSHKIYASSISVKRSITDKKLKLLKKDIYSGKGENNGNNEKKSYLL